jgi:hypothetical protein
MSEAGLSVAKPGHQWRLVGQRPSENAGGACGTCRWKTPRACGSRPIGVGWGKRALAVSGPIGLPVGAGPRQGACGAMAPGSRTAENAGAGRSRIVGVFARTGQVAAAGRRGVNHVTTQGRRCRQRLFDVVTQGLVLLLTHWRRREDRAECDGPGGESRGLGSWDPSGYS